MKKAKQTIIVLIALFVFHSQIIFSGWNQQTSGTTNNLYAAAFLNNMVGWAVGDVGTIIKTTNEGVNWVTQTSGTTETLYSISIIDANNATACGSAGVILRTTNGGTNWSIITSPVSGILRTVQFVGSSIGYINSQTGACLKTTNNGANWFVVNSQISTYGSHWCIFFKSTTNGLACEDGGYANQTTDGGVTWFDSWNGIGSQTLYSIEFENSIYGWVVGNEGGLYLSSDGGYNWTESYYSLDSSSSNTYYSVYTLSANLAYCVGAGGIIITTTNAGQNWYGQSNPVSYDLRSIKMVSNTEGWIAGGNGVILHTTDGGGPIGIKNISSIVPKSYSLFQNYPNPFNPTTTIKFDIPKAGNTKIIIYDIIGKEVEKIFDQNLNAGSYEVEWNASNYSSGVYFFRMISGDFAGTKKMTLIK